MQSAGMQNSNMNVEITQEQQNIFTLLELWSQWQIEMFWILSGSKVTSEFLMQNWNAAMKDTYIFKREMT